MYKSNQSLKSLKINNKDFYYYDLNLAAKDINLKLESLPYSLRVLFENTLRFSNATNDQSLTAFPEWLKNRKSDREIPFMPSRVLMQDFTGVPAIVDLAAMRDAMKKLGGDPTKINPLIPVDLVIDHSVQVDKYGSNSSLQENTILEMQRNYERYEFLRWGQKVFNNFRVVPPGTGICHQVNLEFLSKVVWQSKVDGKTYIFPDTLVGTDSHTTMVNGLAVLGWGVGGIEAEAAMLGQSLPMLLPEVIGVKLSGKLKEGVTATDLVLTITNILRSKGVVGKFVEFFGTGLDNLSLANRSTIANMAPEYGATCGFFPVDNETLKYLELSNRSEEEVKLVETYAKTQKLWRDPTDNILYTDIVELDLTSVEACMAGPKRPQDKILLKEVAGEFNKTNEKKSASIENYNLSDGSVVIAAITSCTNTSNPYVMVGAGLVARKALKLGLKVKPWVKTSLAPGSKVVTEYLEKNGLDKDLNAFGFNITGYGCTTCIGNSGPLKAPIEEAITKNNLTVASVLSGNRNFEGRIHPLTKINYLASPPLVVAYAIAGNVSIDITKEALGQVNGKDIFLKDIWPTDQEIEDCVGLIDSKMFSDKYQDVFKGELDWQEIKIDDSNNYNWNYESTYINNPPYFTDITKDISTIKNINGAKLIALFGDSITTDHISPAGNIAKNSPAAKYLLERGVLPADFNSYGARRGNHDVMMRGTFANIRIKNELLKGEEGGNSIYTPTKEKMPIFDACMKYKETKTPLIVIAGKEYGTGSSRDWAAKGTKLLGISAVIAESFERIHRSNLVGMGVMPLVFINNMNRKDLNLTGEESFDIIGLENITRPNQEVKCIIKYMNGEVKQIALIASIFTDNEIEYLKHNGILHKVIRDLL